MQGKLIILPDQELVVGQSGETIHDVMAETEALNLVQKGDKEIMALRPRFMPLTPEGEWAEHDDPCCLLSNDGTLRKEFLAKPGQDLEQVRFSRKRITASTRQSFNIMEQAHFPVTDLHEVIAEYDARELGNTDWGYIGGPVVTEAAKTMFGYFLNAGELDKLPQADAVNTRTNDLNGGHVAEVIESREALKTKTEARLELKSIGSRLPPGHPLIAQYNSSAHSV